MRSVAALCGLLAILEVGGQRLAAASAPASTEIPPLPKNRRLDQYASRDEFLARAAEFETARLRARPWHDEHEGAFFSADERAVELGGDAPVLRFRKIAASHYREAITPQLRDQLFAIPNRNHDQKRWLTMLDPARDDTVEVPYDYFVSETIVSNAQFARFVRETGYRTTVERFATGWIVDAEAHWLQGFANAWDQQIYPGSEPDRPVVQVSWFDAMNFAAWVSAKAGVIVRVPTKEEWLLAARPPARSDEGCLFPWGNAFDGLERKMNFGTGELNYAWVHDQYSDGHARSSPVTAFPANERGLHDMLGNVWVWNWTNSAAYEARPAGRRAARPVSLTLLGLERNAPLTMTGGCYLARLSHANLLAKMSHPALDGAEDIGFRLVVVRKGDSGL